VAAGEDVDVGLAFGRPGSWHSRPNLSRSVDTSTLAAGRIRTGRLADGMAYARAQVNVL